MCQFAQKKYSSSLSTCLIFFSCQALSLFSEVVVLFLVSKVQLQALFLYVSLKSHNKKNNFPKGSFTLDAMLSRSITTASLQHCFQISPSFMAKKPKHREKYRQTTMIGFSAFSTILYFTQPKYTSNSFIYIHKNSVLLCIQHVVS